MTQVLIVTSWDKYQHYKDRDPPWVKLYRDTLTSESWLLGSDLSRLLQVASTMLAVRYKNKIPLNFTLIKKALSLDCDERSFMAAVSHLVECNFLEIHDVEDTRKRNASNALASCTSETEADKETEAEKNTTAAAPPTRRQVPRETEPDWFLDFKLVYPDRAGDQGWRKAQKAANARIAEGHTPSEFIEGAKRYAAYIAAVGNAGTEYVKQAATFLGPEKPFLLSWNPPASKNQRKQDANIDASLEWLKQQEAADAAH